MAILFSFRLIDLPSFLLSLYFLVAIFSGPNHLVFVSKLPVSLSESILIQSHLSLKTRLFTGSNKPDKKV